MLILYRYCTAVHSRAPSPRRHTAWTWRRIASFGFKPCPIRHRRILLMFAAKLGWQEIPRILPFMLYNLLPFTSELLKGSANMTTGTTGQQLTNFVGRACPIFLELFDDLYVWGCFILNGVERPRAVLFHSFQVSKLRPSGSQSTAH